MGTRAFEHQAKKTELSSLPFETSRFPVASATYPINRVTDFWLLGGASFVAWGFAMAAYFFYKSNAAFDRQIMNWPFAFSAVTLICNHPHFMASYRIAYGNGWKKIIFHWFTLIVIPVALALLFYVAFFIGLKNISTVSWVSGLDAKWVDFPVIGTLVHSQDLGSELLRFGVWVMWVLVGWHYAKQTYGIMIKYSQFDSYQLTHRQRRVLKYCLLAVVPLNFVSMLLHMRGYPVLFQDLPVGDFDIPAWTESVCLALAVSVALVFLGCVLQNYFRTGAKPSFNFMTPFFAFYLWWFPGFWPQPYAMLMVPFFHSLQYLPFAYRRVQKDLLLKERKNFTTTMTINIILILIVGFLLFDLIPAGLDQAFQTKDLLGCSFFLVAIVIFLNIHHFFIDSSIWKSPPR